MSGNRKHKRLLIRLVKRIKSPCATNISRTRAIKHTLKSLKKSKAILICPYWPSGPFWLLLASGHVTCFPFVKDVYLIENPATCVKLGDTKKSVLGSPAYQGYFITILMII